MKIHEVAKVGQKIRRKHWDDSFYIYVDRDDSEFRRDSGNRYTLTLSDIMANDWEIVQKVPTKKEIMEMAEEYFHGTLDHNIFRRNLTKYLEST